MSRETTDRKMGDLNSWCIPGAFRKNEILHYGMSCTPALIDQLEAGEAPDFDVMVATYPRSGGENSCFNLCYNFFMNE